MAKRIAALEQDVSELEKSLEQARHEVAQMDAALRVIVPEIEARLSSTCVWCGTPAPDPTSAEAMRAHVAAHVRVCSGHPMRMLETERDAALADNAAFASEMARIGEWAAIARQRDLEGAVRALLEQPHPGAALLEVVSELRQYQHRDEPDVLATLRRLLEERSRIAHMVSTEQHRKALVRARNEGLERAALLFVTLEQDSDDEGDMEAALDARHWIMRIRALKEPEEGGQS